MKDENYTVWDVSRAAWAFSKSLFLAEVRFWLWTFYRGFFPSIQPKLPLQSLTLCMTDTHSLTIHWSALDILAMLCTLLVSTLQMGHKIFWPWWWGCWTILVTQALCSLSIYIDPTLIVNVVIVSGSWSMPLYYLISCTHPKKWFSYLRHHRINKAYETRNYYKYFLPWPIIINCDIGLRTAIPVSSLITYYKWLL
jgi:hypothetical protein